MGFPPYFVAWDFFGWNKPLLMIEALREELYWCLYNSSLLGVRSGHPENRLDISMDLRMLSGDVLMRWQC